MSEVVFLDSHLQPLMELGSYAIHGVRLDFEAAHQELRGRLELGGGGLGSAYTPMTSGHATYFPACQNLAAGLRINLLNQDGLNDLDYKLAFMDVAVAVDEEADSFRLHVDADISEAHHRNPRVPVAAKEVTRLLFNADLETPFSVRFLPRSRVELDNEYGVEISAEGYYPLDDILNNEIPRRVQKIPPRSEDTIYGLKFVSSMVPHAGATHDPGHFLIAYGAYSDPPY